MFKRFTKKKQREYVPLQPPRDLEVGCPNCGTIHTFHFVDCNTLFLDGTPTAPISQLLKMTVICPKCSFFFMTSNPLYNPTELFQTPRYQDALKQQYASEEERKIALFDALYQLSFSTLYYAHYYREIGNYELEQQWLHKAIQDIIDNTAKESYTIPSHALAAFDTHASFYLSPDRRLVDLYRRTNQMQKALEQIAELRAKEYDVPPAMFFEYLDYEEQLIRKHITNAV